MELWQQRLRSARAAAGISRSALAVRSGISESSIRSYEIGRRRASREHLLSMLDALGLDRQSRNVFMAEAGFASEEPRQEQRTQRRTQREAAALVRARPWPSFLINEQFAVIAVNDVGLQLAGVSRRSLRDANLNLFSLATRQGADARLLNWEDAVRRTISRIKASRSRLLSEPDAYLGAVLTSITHGDPALLRRLAKLWKSTPADLTRHTSWAYESEWTGPHGSAMRFYCTAHTVSASDGLDIHDWIPADAESHRLLDAIRGAATRSARAPN